MKIEFDKERIPDKALYAAHRIAVLAPTHLLEEANRYLDDPQFESVHAQWRELRRAALALLQRCDTALRRLEGLDATLPSNDDDLGLFSGIRAPIVDAIQALIGMNEHWLRADREALQAYKSVSDKLLPFYAELTAEIDSWEEANRRLRGALAAFAPATA